MNWTNIFIQKKIKNLCKNSGKRHHEFRSMDDIRNMLIFIDDFDQCIVEFGLKQLVKQGKQVQFCIYTNNEEFESEKEEYIYVNEERDLNKFAFPNEPLCRQIKDISTDILIDLTESTSYPMHYLALIHPATFKVGIKRDNNELYDFSIIPPPDREDDLAFIFDQILFYLKTIRSK